MLWEIMGPRSSAAIAEARLSRSKAVTEINSVTRKLKAVAIAQAHAVQGIR